MNDGCETLMLSNTSTMVTVTSTATGTSPRRRSNDDYCRLRRAAGSQSLSKLIEIITNEEWTAAEIDNNGDDDNSSNGNGKSALHMAAWKGCIENVQYLIENVGCDINSYSKQKFSYGKTAIFFSITQSRIEITDYLLNCHQDNNSKNTIRVTIINNKGQSVLSIAASHFNAGSDVLEKIIELDSIQGNDSCWWNFRESHSDNFEYGDLDPRFIDRPLCNTDVVTSLVINPTTKQTRKGGFSRRNNPDTTVNTAVGTAPKINGKTEKKQSKRRMNSIKRKKEASLLSALSSHEQYELEEAWENIVSSTSSSAEQSSSLLLLRIVHLSDKQNFAWIPEMTTKLIDHFGGSKDKTIKLIESTIQNNLCQRQRQKELLQKILHRLQGVKKQQQQQQQQSISSGTTITKTPNVLSSSSFEPCWKIICHEVRHLDMSYLEKKKTTNFPTILCLPNPPIFVDTVEQLTILQKCIMDRRLIAIDTEWYNTIHEEEVEDDDDDNNNNNNDSNNHNRQKTTTTTTITLSTLQISYLESESSKDILSYVVDLKKGAVLATTAIANYNGNINGDGDGDGDNTSNVDDDDDYHRLVQALVRWLLHKSGPSLVENDNHDENSNPFYVLGFSIGHDIPLLEAFLLRGNNNNKNNNDKNSEDCTLSSSSSHQLDYHHILDLQKLILAQQQQESSSSSSSSTTTTNNNNPPGLKKCVEQYSSLSSTTTKMAMISSKEEQCSNWELDCD